MNDGGGNEKNGDVKLNFVKEDAVIVESNAPRIYSMPGDNDDEENGVIESGTLNENEDCCCKCCSCCKCCKCCHRNQNVNENPELDTKAMAAQESTECCIECCGVGVCAACCIGGDGLGTDIGCDCTDCYF